jgi:hypothetical protein
MKHQILFSFLFIAIALTSCNKEFPDDPLAIDKLSVSDCKTKGDETKGDETKGIDPEYITIKTVDDYYLHFSHFNSILNCEPGKIILAIVIKSDTISVNETEESSLANCVCPYDIDFRLGPLEYGIYPVKFKKGGLTFKEYSLNYNKSTDVRINIQP